MSDDELNSPEPADDPILVDGREVLARDAEHLKLLSIFYYVFAGLMGLAGCFPIIHLGLGLAMLGGAFQGPGNNGPPAEVGGIFVCVAGFLILLFWSLAAVLALTGKRLSERRGHLFCQIVAGVICLSIPLGTALGVFTFIVLQRPSVKRLFGVA